MMSVLNMCVEQICTNTNDNIQKYIFIATIWHILQLSLSKTNATFAENNQMRN